MKKFSGRHKRQIRLHSFTLRTNDDVTHSLSLWANRVAFSSFTTDGCHFWPIVGIAGEVRYPVQMRLQVMVLISKTVFIKYHRKCTKVKRSIFVSFNSSLYPSDEENPFGSKNKLLTVDLECSTLKQTLTQNPRSESVKLIGSCDGLICLLCRPDNFFLLNPAPIILF